VCGESHPLCRQAIDIGRVDFGRTKTSDIAVAQIIGEEKDDVGARTIGGESRARSQVKREEQDESKWLSDGDPLWVVNAPMVPIAHGSLPAAGMSSEYVATHFCRVEMTSTRSARLIPLSVRDV